jgi:hypothetical protein
VTLVEVSQRVMLQGLVSHRRDRWHAAAPKAP